MAIAPTRYPWKPSLFTQYRIRIANELRLAQSNESCEALRRRIALVEEDIIQLVKQIPSIDFVQLEQTLKSCQTKQERTLAESSQVKQQLTQLTPKLLIGNAYFRARLEDVPLAAQAILPKKRRKRLKLSLDQQWRKGVGDAYRRLQTQRDKEDLSRPDSSVHISELLPTPNDFPVDEPPFLAQTIPDFVREHEFLPPLPPPAIDEIIIPFQTPPPPPSIAARSPPSDRLQLAVDDTIVKPHRLVNKTLGNITQMSFHIDPEQCSSPKGEDRKKKHKLKKALLPPPPPPPPLFSSTAIFDTNAFFTQTTSKAKKQKKKIDISRQPAVLTTNDVPKKRGRTKKSSPYDFQDDDDDTTLSTTRGAKVLADDFITARFAKNSHFQSHQSSMASTKSSKSQRRCTERERKKQKKNVLGIGTSSPLRPGKGNRTR